jgi:hypothetical protein
MSDGLCQERAGFLFKHACHETALHTCERCGKAICNLHVAGGHNGEQWCITCDKTGGRSSEETVDSRSEGHGRQAPFYYGSMWYGGYGHYHSGWGHHHYHDHHHDSNDFTEGDQEALGEPGDEGFEQDLDAS